MDKDHKNNNSNTAGDNSVDEAKSNTSKDIKKEIDKFESKIKSGEATTGDATRSDE
jgi:hypothetical protein